MGSWPSLRGLRGFRPPLLKHIFCIFDFVFYRVALAVDAALIQRIVDKLLRQTVEGGKDRHAHDHADDAEQIAADHNRKEYPQCRDANGRPEDFGADEVAVQLLDDEDQHTEDDRLQRIYQQQDKHAWDCADKGTEHRDNIRNADKHADQHGKIKPQDRHGRKGDNADDGGVDDLAHKKAREVYIGVVADAQRVGGHLLRQEGVRQRAQLVQQMVLVRQHVDAGRDRGKDRHKVGCHAADARHDLRHGFGCHCIDFLDHCLGIIKHFSGLLQVDAVLALDIEQHFLHALYVAGEVREQHTDAVYDLRHDQPGQQHKQQNRHGVGQQDGKAARALLLLEQFDIEEFDHRVKDIGDDDAARKRRQNVDKNADAPEEIPQIVQKQIKCNTGPDHAEPVQHRLRPFGPDVFFVQMLRPSLS